MRAGAAATGLITLWVLSACTQTEPTPTTPAPSLPTQPAPPSASPSASQQPTASGVDLRLMASAEDPHPPGGYGLVGKPDGLGLTVIDGEPTLLVTHELYGGEGVERSHGSAGAFVSRWRLSADEPAILGGSDLLTRVEYWDYPRGRPSSASVLPGGSSDDATTGLAKLCSAFLSEPGQLWDASTSTGFDGQLFFLNEESKPDGRGFAAALDGVAYQLPRLGLFGRENTVIATGSGRTTLAVTTEDSTQGQLYVYTGDKRASGSPVERAGLMDGSLSVVSLVDGPRTGGAFRKKYGKGQAVRFTLSPPIDTTAPATKQADEAKRVGLTFARLEDAAFDPRRPTALYFVTTIGGDTHPAPGAAGRPRDGGGLWRLDFADVARPELGGTLTLLLDGSEPPFLDGPDNVVVDQHGNVLIQEDPTTSSHPRRIVAYRISDGAVGVVTHVPLHAGDPVDRTGGSAPNARYESSGIIDASSVYGDGWFLFDVQAHDTDGLTAAVGRAEAAARVQRGFLYALFVGDWAEIYANPGS